MVYYGCKLQNIISTSFRDVRSGSREGTKSCLVLHREIQENRFLIVILLSYQVCDKESVSSKSMDCQTHNKDEQ